MFLKTISIAAAALALAAHSASAQQLFYAIPAPQYQAPPNAIQYNNVPTYQAPQGPNGFGFASPVPPPPAPMIFVPFSGGSTIHP